MAGFPPDMGNFLGSLQSGGGNNNTAMAFLAGHGFQNFANTIKKLQDIVGGSAVSGDVTRGLTSKPSAVAGQQVANRLTPPQVTPPTMPSVSGGGNNAPLNPATLAKLKSLLSGPMTAGDALAGSGLTGSGLVAGGAGAAGGSTLGSGLMSLLGLL